MRIFLLNHPPHFIVRVLLTGETYGSSSRVHTHGSIGHLIKEVRQGKVGIDICRWLHFSSLRLDNLLNGDLLVGAPRVQGLSRLTLLVFIVGRARDDDQVFVDVAASASL